MENPADRAAGATGTLMSARGHEKLLRNLRCQRMSTSPSSDCRRDDHGCRFVPNTPIMRPILGRRELVEIDPDHEFRLRQLPGGAPVIRGGVAGQGDAGPHTIPIATAPSAANTAIRYNPPRPAMSPDLPRRRPVSPRVSRRRPQPASPLLRRASLRARSDLDGFVPGFRNALRRGIPTTLGAPGELVESDTTGRPSEDPGPRALPGYCFRVA